MYDEKAYFLERNYSIVSHEDEPDTRPPQDDPAYCLDKGLYEFYDFLAKYRRLGKGAFEDWQIVSAVASSIYAMLKKGRNCPGIERLIVNVVTRGLDEVGINRWAVHRAYLHGTDERVLAILNKVFPNIVSLSPNVQHFVETSRRVSPAESPSYSYEEDARRERTPIESRTPSSWNYQKTPFKLNLRKASRALVIISIIFLIVLIMMAVLLKLGL